MSLMLDEHEDFSLQANVEVAGEQRMVMRGYLVSRRADGTYVAPLIPQLFYGAAGTQLQTWRQDLAAGQQTVLSRSGGQPSVPKHELAWRKMNGGGAVQTQQVSVAALPTLAEPINPWLLVGLASVGLLAVFGLYKLVRKK